MVNAYIEMVPSDSCKYEMDKESGFLRLDRPNMFSAMVPCLYGFIPQTYCGDGIGGYAAEKSGKTKLKGDGDALDICVLTEKVIPHGDFILQAIPIGGLRMIDGGEADDKIIAVLKGDSMYGNWKSIEDASQKIIDRICHYFLTYKDLPKTGISEKKTVEITHVYSVEEAKKVISISIADYNVLKNAK
jgi:inorganic pyrophosphatase